MASPGSGRETEGQIAKLVEIRARVGRLRRALAPHREVFATLSHAELDLISTDVSAERFEKLTEQVDGALATARDAKDAVVSSFDVLILRTEHRTNEIVKVLTLASILLLPGALIAGVAGMNVNFSAGTFATLAALLGRAGGDRRTRRRDAHARARSPLDLTCSSWLELRSSQAPDRSRGVAR